MHAPMPRNILILNGHPDPASTGLCHALANAYEEGARSAGHVVRDHEDRLCRLGRGGEARRRRAGI